MLIRSGDVTLRLFDASQSDIVYAIRNHPTVRVHLRDAQPIARDSHDRWIRDNLIEAQRLWLFIVRQGSDPVGIALLRNVRERTAEIGVMLVEAARHQLAGYKAAHLIGYYGFEVIDLERLFSYVPHHNARALLFNRRCGFLPTGKVTEVYHELVLTREQSRTHPTHQRFRAKYGIELIDEKSGPSRTY